MKQNLTRKQLIIRFFSVTGMTGQNQHNWPDFFLSGNVFWGLGQGRSQGARSKCCYVVSNVVSDFQICCSKCCFRFL